MYPPILTKMLTTMASIETGSPRNLSCVMMVFSLTQRYEQRNAGLWGRSFGKRPSGGGLLAATQQLPIGRTYLQRIYLRHRHYGMIELEKLTVPGIRTLHHQQTSK